MSNSPRRTLIVIILMEPGYQSNLQQALAKLKSPEDLLSLGTEIKLSKSGKFNKVFLSLDEKTIKSLTPEQIMGLCILIPLPQGAKLFLQIFGEFVLYKHIISKKTYKEYSTKIGLSMKYVRALAETDYIKDPEVPKIMKQLYEFDKVLYTTAYLYYLCQSKHPDNSVDPIVTGVGRVDVLNFYYSGINRLLLKEYSRAESDLIHSLLLSKHAKDVRQQIISKLSIASFLNHTSYEVFISRLKPKFRTIREKDPIWKLDSPIECKDKFLKIFAKELTIEHAIRVLVDAANTMTVVPLEQIKALCGVEEIEPIINHLRKSGEINITIKDDIVSFAGVCINNKIEDEIKLLSSFVIE
ncbi:hypothetical protein GPJ56_006474 [Histomonas meleagridis]|uniref:uncharacterized protein n=1 Tax=Histomonas meleagridis TaxID=135588 RepID=UPI003559BAB3|nr:hypothetical protein GPJ56_006474 [Histomonas meleagridis]KAH0798844.1 hypothetical protein GO595_008330 [Histomonas meleagridis]